MTVHEALRTRRTVHRFRSGPVDDDVLDRALEAATLAPNHKLTWPWRFVLPGPVVREHLAQLNVRLKSVARPLDAASVQRIRHKMLTPDRLVVVAQVLDGAPSRQLEDYATCACAIQNLSLSLHVDGIASKWSTGRVTTHEETYRLLGLDASTVRIIGFVWAGHPEVIPTAAPRPTWRDACSTTD